MGRERRIVQYFEFQPTKLNTHTYLHERKLAEVSQWQSLYYALPPAFSEDSFYLSVVEVLVHFVVVRQ